MNNTTRNKLIDKNYSAGICLFCGILRSEKIKKEEKIEDKKQKICVVLPVLRKICVRKKSTNNH